MELKQKSLELKNNLISSLHQWADSRIDGFFVDYPQFKPASVYIKRGVKNILLREDKKVEDWIDNAMLFLADENGNYNKELLFDDAMAILKDLPEKGFSIGPLQGTAGQGVVRFILPSNPITSLLSEKGAAFRITISQSDFEELRAIFTGEL